MAKPVNKDVFLLLFVETDGAGAGLFEYLFVAAALQIDVAAAGEFGRETLGVDAFQVDAAGADEVAAYFGHRDGTGCDGAHTVDVEMQGAALPDVAEAQALYAVERGLVEAGGADVDGDDGFLGHAVAAVGGEAEHAVGVLYRYVRQYFRAGLDFDEERVALVECDIGKAVYINLGENVDLEYILFHTGGVDRRFGYFLDYLVDVTVVAGCDGRQEEAAEQEVECLGAHGSGDNKREVCGGRKEVRVRDSRRRCR